MKSKVAASVACTLALVAGLLVASDKLTTITPVAAAAGTGGGVEAITPTRVLDTRTTNGGHNAPFAAGEVYTLVLTGRGAIPSFGVAAVLVNLTVVAPSTPTGGGYLTAYPSGVARPTASNVNFSPGQTVANSALVGLGPDGAISIYIGFASDVHVIIDVQGWVAQTLAEGAGPSIPFDQTTLSAPDSVKARQILANANKYAMLTWWPGDAQTLLAAPLGNGANNLDAVRRMSMEALALSTAIATGAYVPPSPEATATVAADRINTLLNRVASQHLVNQVEGWGDHWQSAMWAAIAGRAAWYIWSRPELTASTRQLVTRVVEHEANFAARYKLHYLRNPSGILLTGGDSGAEEVSWLAGAMQIAAVMLPTNPHVAIWKAEVVQYALAAWGRPEDVANTTIINGAPISAWIKGSNVESNGVVINHNRIASDYSTTTYQNLDVAPLFALSGRQIPRATTALLGPVYAAFRDVTFTGGGQTYVEHSADIFYPDGNEWGTGQKLPYALSDAQALVYGYDPGWATEYLNLHLDSQLAMQARFGDGHTYLNDLEYNYQGREEHVAQLASQLYLTFYMRDRGLVTFDDASYWM